MPISETYKVDFSPYRKDMTEKALGRLLSQFQGSCILRQLVAAIMDEVQELYDALIDLQEQRTLYAAEEENLDALGRIVGEPRAPYQYDESRYLFADRANQRPDSAVAWCVNAPFSAFVPVADDRYRVNILARIFKNHTLTASVPELERLTRLLTGSRVSFEKTGPMRVMPVVSSSISATAYGMLTLAGTDRCVEEAYMLPYPATLRLDDRVMHAPEGFLCADRNNKQQCDHAPCAVSVPNHQEA